MKSSYFVFVLALVAVAMATKDKDKKLRKKRFIDIVMDTECGSFGCDNGGNLWDDNNYGSSYESKIYGNNKKYGSDLDPNKFQYWEYGREPEGYYSGDYYYYYEYYDDEDNDNKGKGKDERSNVE